MKVLLRLSPLVIPMCITMLCITGENQLNTVAAHNLKLLLTQSETINTAAKNFNSLPKYFTSPVTIRDQAENFNRYAEDIIHMLHDLWDVSNQNPTSQESLENTARTIETICNQISSAINAIQQGWETNNNISMENLIMLQNSNNVLNIEIPLQANPAYSTANKDLFKKIVDNLDKTLKSLKNVGLQYYKYFNSIFEKQTTASQPAKKSVGRKIKDFFKIKK